VILLHLSRHRLFVPTFVDKCRSILQGRDPAKLDSWLDDAHRSGLYGLRRFAHTIRYDLAAVRNAISERWSNGQTEGQINRLKPSNDKCMAALEPNGYALDSFLCSATSSPQIEEYPKKYRRAWSVPPASR
jgi:hypothetical protein